MEIRNLVGGEVVAVEPGTTLLAASRLMKKKEIGSLAVMTGGHLEGILTERDVMHAVAQGADPATAIVKNWMTSGPDTFDAEMDVTEVIDWMLATGYRHLPVVEDDVFVGIASIKDVLWAITAPGG